MNLNDTEKESNCTCAAVSWSSQSRCGMVVHGREWETQNASICFRKRARALITSASLSFLSMLISLGADLNVVVWVLFFSFFFSLLSIFAFQTQRQHWQFVRLCWISILSAFGRLFSQWWWAQQNDAHFISLSHRTVAFIIISNIRYIYIHMYRLGIHYV